MKKLIILAFLTITSLTSAQEKKEAVKIYNPGADARSDINAAIARAKKANKHVLYKLGVIGVFGVLLFIIWLTVHRS